MLAGIPLTFALCFNASAVDQEVQRTSATAIWQTYFQRSLTAAKGAEIGHHPILKWSGKFGQRAKVYPTRTNGYENDKTTELFRPV